MSNVTCIFEARFARTDMVDLLEEAMFCGQLLELAIVTETKLTDSEWEWCRATFAALIRRTDDPELRKVCEAALKVLAYIA